MSDFTTLSMQPKKCANSAKQYSPVTATVSILQKVLDVLFTPKLAHPKDHPHLLVSSASALAQFDRQPPPVAG